MDVRRHDGDRGRVVVETRDLGVPRRIRGRGAGERGSRFCRIRNDDDDRGNATGPLPAIGPVRLAYIHVETTQEDDEQAQAAKEEEEAPSEDEEVRLFRTCWDDDGRFILFLGSRERVAVSRMLRITEEEIHPIQKREILSQLGGGGGGVEEDQSKQVLGGWGGQANKMQNKRSLWRDYFPL